jgi:hypothetical protein
MLFNQEPYYFPEQLIALRNRQNILTIVVASTAFPDLK